MLTRYEMLILKRAQKKLQNLSDVALKQKRPDAAKNLSDESAVLYKVIAILEEKDF